MRVIAGTARSLRLVTPEGLGTRPTQDRIKETLFNIIQNDIPGSVFLDIFSGSGGIGIEALSRGAKKAVFIDNDKEAVTCIMQNLAHTKFENRAEVLAREVFVALQTLEYKSVFDYVLIDPPYSKDLEKKVLEYLTTSTIINNDTVIIFETSIDTDVSYLDDLGYNLLREKIYKTNKHVFISRKEK